LRAKHGRFLPYTGVRQQSHDLRKPDPLHLTSLFVNEPSQQLVVRTIALGGKPKPTSAVEATFVAP
jgi:hypothetical protein